jgi:hypothetical protein
MRHNKHYFQGVLPRSGFINPGGESPPKNISTKNSANIKQTQACGPGKTPGASYIPI